MLKKEKEEIGLLYKNQHKYPVGTYWEFYRFNDKTTHLLSFAEKTPTTDDLSKCQSINGRDGKQYMVTIIIISEDERSIRARCIKPPLENLILPNGTTTEGDYNMEEHELNKKIAELNEKLLAELIKGEEK